ncbi:protein-L-isoaspartate(D-aspartate) O-methyltransferase [Rhizoctonia solani]|uniref:Protein-L-isoaspartate(D-aspartate) O-methyltransferase n=1 Tax=Rhizoctonia solani TaxID=456999 RepID=A0A8H8SWI8_9AGAM|nr:protein-L-isoaspartate(D-aspartate) O-methyltransferase [Rhizoctonia solani]QRW19243.1 protein-L-isoaspartate(D-aspartate) O-methyltransferase [Rhizoctonia solani]
MAWACSGKTNVELVNNMLNAGLFKSELVGEALRRVDRVNYVRNKHDAYYDSPQLPMHVFTKVNRTRCDNLCTTYGKAIYTVESW